MSKKLKLDCKHEFVLLKQLFKNGTTHITGRCKFCKKISVPNYYPKTKENLIRAVGWVKESEETKLIDELLGLSGLKPNEVHLTKYEEVKKKVAGKSAARDSQCGNCHPCVINEKYGECICPHHEGW